MSLCMAKILGICLTSLQLTSGGVDVRKEPLHERTPVNFWGNSFDLTKFYTPEDPKVSVNGYAVLNNDTKVTFGYNNGTETEKYELTDKNYLGIDKYFISEDKDEIFQIGVSSSWGGDVSHTPCNYANRPDKKLYCVDLTDWDKFENKEIDNPVENRITLRYTYRF